jgi:hypothetical protein
MDDLPQFAEGGSILSSSGRDSLAGLTVYRAPPGGLGLYPDRNPIGDAGQPGPQRSSVADLLGVANQGHERRLDCVLGILMSFQDPTADAHDRRPVLRHQDLEGRFGLVACPDQE